MDEFKFYIDVSDWDISIEDRGDSKRIYFRCSEAIERVLKLLKDLKIYAKYHNR